MSELRSSSADAAHKPAVYDALSYWPKDVYHGLHAACVQWQPISGKMWVLDPCSWQLCMLATSSFL